MFIIDRIKQEILTNNKDEISILINNYLNCYDQMDKEKLEILKNVFINLKSYEIRSCDVINENKILDGYELIEKNKKTNDQLNLENIKFKINSMLKEIDNINDAYFFKNFLNLIDSIKFIENDEIITLNFLFNEIINGDEFKVMNNDNKYQILIKN